MLPSTPQMMNPKQLSLSLGFFYFSFFAGIGIFAPFFPLYCKDIGLSALQIGVTTAIMPLSNVMFPHVWAYLADRFQARKGVAVIASLLSLLFFLPFFYVETFLGLAVSAAIFSFFRVSTLPLIESIAMDASESGTIRYGQIRIWGSIGFIVLSFLLGRLIDFTSSRIALHALFIVIAMNFLATLTIPAERGAIESEHSELKSLLWDKKIVLFFIACLLMQVSHGTLYGFFTIHLATVGYHKSTIGALWAISVISEIFVLYYAHKWVKKDSLLTFFSVSFLIAGIRWGVLAMTTALIPIALAQISHAATYGIFHIAAINYTHERFTGRTKTLGQSLYGGVTYGGGNVLGFMFNGLFYETLGADSMFALSGAIALIGFVCALRLTFLKRESSCCLIQNR
jgi:PPP family 3-phenylpropionic acid transporter